MLKIIEKTKQLIHLSAKDDDDDDEEDEELITILGEIIGATNLVAAKRNKEEEESSLSLQPQPPKQNHFINAYCVVYWGDEIIHKTKVLTKNNNPIWSCDTGALFLIHVNRKHLRNNSFLRIELIDRISKKKQESIGEVIIECQRLISNEWCNETRKTMSLIQDHQEKEVPKDQGNWHFSNELTNSLTTVVTAGMSLFETSEDAFPEDDSIDDEDSIYGKSTRSLHDETEIDDDFVFGKNGKLALRFRVANQDDINFIKAIEIFDRGYKHAKKSKQQILSGVKMSLDGKLLAHLITEHNSSLLNICSHEEFHRFLDYTCYGKHSEFGVQKRRVKPGPDPSKPKEETEYLTEADMKEYSNQPSTRWVEAGSGMVGRVYVEIISCEGLHNKSISKLMGKKADPFVCLVYEDCLVETDVIRNCNNPMFMPWSQRAFVFNTMHALSSLYVGVFDHDYGPVHHKGLGRVTIDLNELKPDTKYTLKYNLYSSPVTSVRKLRGTVTLKIQMETYSDRKALLSILTPPILHVNVKRRKTLEVARYTCYGKYREDVYNMKILRGYIDELLEYLEQLSDELNYALDSLFFWRGQVTIRNTKYPLYSAFAYLTAIYVIERPHLFLSYFFFCCAWILFIVLHKRSNYPSPMYRSKSFLYHLRSLLPRPLRKTNDGEEIDAFEGHLEEQIMKRIKKKRMEKNQRLKSQIAHVRNEMQKILVALTDLSMDTSEGGVNYNPLSRLLPVQLVLRDVMYYVRFVKSLVSCDDSAMAFILIASFTAIGFVLLFLPCGFIFHWVVRIFVWLFMGPWMRLAETAAARHDGSTNQLKKIVEEIQEREQQRLLAARIKSEEAIKLKATRVMRFGRFAIRVPFTNITRYYDQPLPDSHAERATLEQGDYKNLNVTHYIPGQKHHGVMIPELSGVDRKEQSLATQLMHKKKKSVQFFDQWTSDKCRDDQIISNATILNDSSCAEGEFDQTKPSVFGKLGELIVEKIQSTEENEDGFEIVPLTSSIKRSNNQANGTKIRGENGAHTSNVTPQDVTELCDNRQDERYTRQSLGENLEKRCLEDKPELIPTAISQKSVSMKIHHVFSDLTEN